MRTIVVNDSWKLAPWADVLYAADARWWKPFGVAAFPGLKVTCQTEARHFAKVLEVELGAHRFLTERGVLGDGRNGGFQAINLAIQFGARRIVLVGFDMRIDHGIHWHGPHGDRLSNPDAGVIERWRKLLDDAAGGLPALGVEVLNASPGSALIAFPKVSLEAALR